MFLLASCSSEDIATKEIATETPQTGRQHLLPLANGAYLTTDLSEDTLLTAIAKITAVMQQQPEFRSFIIEQLVTRQTSEQTVLYISNQDQEIKAGLTLSAAMAQTASDLGYEFESSFFATDLSKRMPRLSFTIYLSDNELAIENWDYAAPIPVVAETEQFSTGKGYYASAYLPESTQPIHNEDDPSFDAMVIENNRSFFLLSAEPSEVEIKGIIWQHWQFEPCNELVDQVLLQVTRGAMSSSLLIYQNEDINLLERYQLVEHLNECGMEEAMKDAPVVNSADRDSRFGSEIVVAVRVPHSKLKDFCKWWKSDCEIAISSGVAGLNSSGSLSLGSIIRAIHGPRKDMKNDQKYTDPVQTFIWRYLEGEHADPYNQSFVGKHHNAGNTKTFEFSFTPTAKIKDPNTGLEVSYSMFGAKATINATINDEDLYSQFIYYAHGLNRLYNTGMIEFWVTKRITVQ